MPATFAVVLAIAVLPALAAVHPLAAQWPGRIEGRVVDGVTGAPLAHVTVELPALSRRTVSDPAGAFRLPAVDPGDHRLTFTRVGYAPAAVVLSVHNGAVARPLVRLQPAPMELESVGVRVERSAVGGGYRIGAAEIASGGARTVADLLRGRSAVVVSERGVGGPQTVSIRGVAADAVLVLLDGVPLNDPVTGEADLSRVSTSTVEEVAVLPGARSARYGPRAQGGVVLIRTRSGDARPTLRAEGGSLGRWGLSGEMGGALGRFLAGAGVDVSGLGGGFRFRQPAEVGGTPARRENADVSRLAGWAAASGPVAGGDARARAGVERLDRGLPGKSFAPSRAARQVATRAQASASWTRARTDLTAVLHAYGALDEARFRDLDPALGPPFDTRTRVRAGGFDADVLGEWGGTWRPALGATLDAEVQRVSSGALDERAPRRRTELGAALHGAVTLGFVPVPTRLSLAGRVYRDGLGGGWPRTHEVELNVGDGPVSIHLAQRNGFSPPGLGDQYFHQGVAVAPNPDLGPERVPSEWEGGFSFTVGAPARLYGGASVFRGDVRGMIVWQPDFRFVWSPRNVDVRRDGAEAWLSVEAPMPGTGLLRLRGDYSLARVTYDRDDPEPVQVLYRPRHSAALRAEAKWNAWSGGLVARYLGARFPVPSPVNELPGFWSVDASLRHAWRWSGWRVETRLRVDRLLDQKDALIFGFPEPGRTLAFSVEVQRLP